MSHKLLGVGRLKLSLVSLLVLTSDPADVCLCNAYKGVSSLDRGIISQHVAWEWVQISTHTYR